MIISPVSPDDGAPAQALEAFLGQCQALARARGRPILASISIQVSALDPLAVLEAIYEENERHFYVERPSAGFALAGAEAVVSFEASGPGRFAAVQQFITETLENAVVAGAVKERFSGPHFFTAFTFFDDVGEGEAFKSATVFVPRWQVAQVDGRTTAVANLLVAGDSPLSVLAAKILRARGKFEGFEYAPTEFPVEGGIRGRNQVREADGGTVNYVDAVKSALGQIAAGEFEKIVLARAKEVVSEKAFHPLAVLNGLRESYRECYAFSLANGAGQSFIGASPERLLRVSGGELETEALAGSSRRGASASEDAALGAALLRSEKDLQEHALVWQSIQRRLAPLGIVLLRAAQPNLRKLANVQHLHTPVTAQLPETVKLLDVLARLHPTPAVGGTPREVAVNSIRRYETVPRGLYAGAIGWIDAHGAGEFFVGLRSALIAGGTARLHAGAGIVAGSVPEKELAETELKFRAMQTALAES